MGALSGYSFLIIEDEAVQAYAIRDMLSNLGGNVSKMAFTYEQARDAIDDVLFDCAILDVNLGGALSFRVADLLRSRDRAFVFCTAYADALEVYSGAVDTPYVNKPVEETELLDAVTRALQASQASSRLTRWMPAW